MGTASQGGVRSHRIAVLFVLMLAALALAAATLAGPAQAAPGSVIWKKVVNPTAGRDELRFCARGPSGSLIAVGLAGTASTRGDVWITRYRANGTVQWSRRWDDPAHKWDVVRDMEVDSAGNVYVCGYVDSAPGDSFVLKYSALGTRKWARVHSFGGAEEVSALDVDAAGNVYVTGHEQPVEGSSSLFIARFAAAGGRVDWVWDHLVPGLNSNGLGIVVTGGGVCYIAGVVAVPGDDGDGFVVKVADGEDVWQKVWDGPAGLTDWLHGVALTRAGDVVVAGETGLGGPGDYAALRYSTAGDLLWSDTWNVPGTYTTEWFNDLAVAADGSIWVCGYSSDDVSPDLSIFRGTVVRWSPAGVAVGRTFGSSTTPASFYDLVTDGSGNAYVAGACKRGAAGDGVLVKYKPSLSRAWTTYVRYSAAADDFLQSVALGASGYLYATGTADEESRNPRAMLVRVRR